jgi:diketogulonate reductase-like aldo/keto reductase
MNPQSTITLRTGRTMPVMGLGTWQLTIDTPGTVAYALELGYRMIDTSGDYGTQPGIAKGLRQSSVARSDVYIVTKVEATDDAYEAARRNVAELGLEYADLILIHHPPPSGSGDAGEELWEGLLRARSDGIAKDVGVSNYSVSLIRQLMKNSGEVPAVNQIEWSPFGYSEDMFFFCDENDIALQSYSPLTRGRRLGDDKLAAIATRYDKTPAQILIRWNLELGTIPLPKANHRNHLEENIDVFDFEISDDDSTRLNSLNEHYSSLGSTLQYLA